MEDNNKASFFSTGFFAQLFFGILLMIAPSYLPITNPLWAATMWWGAIIGLVSIVIFRTIKIFWLKNKSTNLEKVPLNNLLKEAKQQGWVFDGTTQILDLGNALRQSASDGSIKLWGRIANKWDDLTKNEPLLEIPKDYWRDSRIDEISSIANINDNVHAATRPVNSQNHIENWICYKDIHVEGDKMWLKKYAVLFKGKRDSK